MTPKIWELGSGSSGAVPSTAAGEERQTGADKPGLRRLPSDIGKDLIPGIKKDGSQAWSSPIYLFNAEQVSKK